MRDNDVFMQIHRPAESDSHGGLAMISVALKAGLVWLPRVAAALFGLALLVGCGGDDEQQPDRGPTGIALSADPNGIYWDAGEQRLYITDDNSNAILTWDGDGQLTF